MQLGTISLGEGRTSAVLVSERGAVLAQDVLDRPYTDAFDVIRNFAPSDIRPLLEAAAGSVFRPASELTFTSPYRKPRMIWGIGLNYREHAADLSETAPAEEPASFIKGDHTVIGPGESIPLPWQSNRVTAEAELGLIIGRTCSNVSEEDALDYVWGVVPILDQTAEDILARNPRFLTRSKNFPGFFSFGPAITPMDEVLQQFGSVGNVRVSTFLNGGLHRSNTVDHMTFGPESLVSFHSEMMPLYPGDIISTGTPGAVQIRDGDLAECRIDGIGTLTNPVTAGGDRMSGFDLEDSTRRA